MNQSDLALIDVVLQRPGTAPEDVLATVPQLDAYSAIDIILIQNLGTKQLEVEFKDSYGNHYQVTV